jgi:hypothetical protein
VRSGRWDDERLWTEACDNARLTSIQAEAARLTARGCSYREIATALSIPYPAARRAALSASEKLRRAHPHLIDRDRRFLRDLFQCLRNTRGRPGDPKVYAPLPGGAGYAKTPLTLRARPMGEVAEDLLLCPVRFLRELPRLLAQSAVSR